MSRTKRGRPSSAILVAVMALVAALAGTALAGSGPSATTAASLKKVEKTANKAKKKAKKANKKAKAAQSSADSAQSSADSAQSTANSAQSSADSAKTSSGFSQRTTTLALPESFTDVVTPVSVTTSGTRIVATGSAALEGNGGIDDAVDCRLRIAGTTSAIYSHDVADTQDDLTTVALTFARTVPPGTHAVEFECERFGSSVDVSSAGLSAVAVGD